MIELFGKFYAKSKEEVLTEKFEGKECNGYYSLYQSGILFSDLTFKVRAFIGGREGEAVLVTASRKPGLGNRIFYMYSTTGVENKWMGIPKSYMAQMEEAAKVRKQVFLEPSLHR